MTTKSTVEPSPSSKLSPKPKNDLEPTLKHQKFSVRRVHRSQLKNALYNPRQIDSYARKKLLENIKRVGLIEPLIWNKKTGNILQGHQRISILDEIEGTSDYMMDVAVVSLTEKEEKEQNVFMNNPSAQGVFDEDMVAKLIAESQIDYVNAGYDQVDVEMLLEESKGVFNEQEANEETQDLLNDVTTLSERATELRKKEAAEKEKSPKATNKELAEIRGKAVTDLVKKTDTELYLVVLFDKRESREAFLEQLGFDSDERYVDGGKLLFKLKEK